MSTSFGGGLRKFKDISIFSSGGHFSQRSIAVCAILAEDIIRNSSMNLSLI